MRSAVRSAFLAAQQTSSRGAKAVWARAYSVGSRLRAAGRWRLLLLFGILLMLGVQFGRHHRGWHKRHAHHPFTHSGSYLIKATTKMEPQACSVAVVSTFPPRPCGIAEFTNNLVQALRSHLLFSVCTFEVIALVDPRTARPAEYQTQLQHPFPVTVLLVDTVTPSPAFWEAAGYLNSRRFSHVLLQHEFGLVPIQWQLVDLARWLTNTTLVTVLHTPRAYPNVEELGNIRQLASLSSWVVVMSWHAYHSMHQAAGIDPAKLLFIPHGVNMPSSDFKPRYASVSQSSPVATPQRRRSLLRSVPVEDAALAKLGPGDLMILGNGLIHKSKGFERLVRVLPSILKQYPNTYFYVVGREHEQNKEKNLMAQLISLARSLGVADHLVWVNAYLSPAALARYFARCDVYITLFDEVTPTSGTLLMAMAHGLPIVSTPYRFALELLSAGDRGMIVPYEDDDVTTAGMLSMLSNSTLRELYGTNAKAFVSNWQWQAVATQYVDIFLDVHNYMYQNDTGVPPPAAPSPPSPVSTLSGMLLRVAMPAPALDVPTLGNVTGALGGYSWLRSHSQPYRPLTHDPFMNDPSLEAVSPPAVWSNKRITTFDHRSLVVATQVVAGVYTLYVDPCMQVNARIAASSQLEVVAVRTPSRWVYVHMVHGVDYEVIPGADNNSTLGPGLLTCAETVTIDYAASVAKFQSMTVAFTASRTPDGITLQFTGASKFSSPHGLLGSTLRCKYEADCANSGVEWDDWRVPSGLLFAHSAKGQTWSTFGISSNVHLSVYQPLPVMVFSNEIVRKYRAEMVIEGPLFDESGFAQVNRRTWFMLAHYTNSGFRMNLQPTDRITKELEAKMDRELEVYLVYSAHQDQLASTKALVKAAAAAAAEPVIAATADLAAAALPVPLYKVVYRNSWPPNWMPPSAQQQSAEVRNGQRIVWIHEQPWEFIGIPKQWVVPLLNAVDELWVPSAYCQDGYAANGIPRDKVAVLPHGVNWEKWKSFSLPAKGPETAVPASTLPWLSKKFRFLFVGGLLPRKGIDVMLAAYEKAFSRRDDVSLLIHSIYGDDFGLKQIKKLQARRNSPHLMLHTEQLRWDQLAALFASANAYVSPYRSEGFGLTIIEAMAAGLPIIVSDTGPVLEFCDTSTSLFVQTKTVPCMHAPCGNMTIFKLPTVLQPQWAEPSVSSLAQQLKHAYQHPSELRNMAERAKRKASEHSWGNVAPKVLSRIEYLVERKYGVVLGSEGQ